MKIGNTLRINSIAEFKDDYSIQLIAKLLDKNQEDIKQNQLFKIIIGLMLISHFY